jgi:benzodiazapine receptor
VKQNESPSWLRHMDFSVVAVLPVLAASVLGQIATTPNIVPWYAGLVKPSFNPPNGIFPPVWATLYLLMAFAVWRIARLPSSLARRTALILFFAQLALNAAWSWMFFAAHSPWLGLVNIVPQFLLVVATIVAAARIDRPAALALTPLAAWVGFACVLNYSIWTLNG